MVMSATIALLDISRYKTLPRVANTEDMCLLLKPLPPQQGVAVIL
jgi:hypothetical protein